MSSLRVFVAEHEVRWRRRIRRFLSLEPGCDLIGECATAAEAAAAINCLRPDILFLADRIPENFRPSHRGPLPVIIVTSGQGASAHPGAGSEPSGALNLAKPFNILRFRDMLERARTRLAQDRLTELYENVARVRRSSDRIAVHGKGRIVFVRLAEIDWIEAADNYVCLHCGRETHVLRETMKDLEARLDPAQFPRVHRSTMVNLDRIKELQPWFRGDYRILLQDGTELTLAKSHRAKLESLCYRSPVSNSVRTRYV